MSTTTTITTRARNLGYSSTSQPTNDGRIAVPTSPDVVGGLRTVEAEIERDRRIYGNREMGSGDCGTFWRAAMFVGGARVLESVSDVLDELRRDGFAVVTLAD